MKALIIPLTLEGPVLMTGIGNGEENSSLTLPYIPGGAVRGALIGQYQSSNDDLLEDETAVRLFFSDQVAFLNAYPAYDKRGVKRSYPVSASWRKEKGTEIADKPEACDFALVADDKFDEAIKQPFCHFESGNNTVTLINPEQELTTHIGGEMRGIVRQQNNTVFQYQALAGEQNFTAVVLTEAEKDSYIIKELLEQTQILHLGRSRSARYGRVHLGPIQTEDYWLEAEENNPNGKTTITLLSDTLLRDSYGQPTLDLDDWLARALNKNELKSEKRFIKPALVGGFNRKWGLPLPQSPALGMGSVFIYDETQISPSDLAMFIKSGIGDRRVEGFGRIAVNWREQEKFLIKEYGQPKPEIFTDLTPSSQKIAQEMAERILRQRLDIYLSEIAQAYSITGNINNHQLARLRNLLRKTINESGQDTNIIKIFLEDLKPTAKEQYRRARVKYGNEASGSRLSAWLEEQLEKKNILSSFSSSRIPEVARQKAILTDLVKTEYTLRMIEAVINHRMKEKREDNQ